MRAQLKGISSTFVSTKRLRSHVLCSGDPDGAPLVLVHGNLASATFFEELMLALSARYRCIAPDIRGFGESEDRPIDATRGLRDPADDLRELMDALGVDAAHLLGWSAGAGVVMQYAIDEPGRTKSLTLIAPVSPYGFGGTCDTRGTPSAKDFSGCGGGTVSADIVAQMRRAEPDSDAPGAARHLLRNFYVKPPCRLDREAALVDAIYTTRLGDRHYPGDFVESEYWPHVAPGHWGIINAVSPKYFNTSGIVDLPQKPPILWVRGDADVIVSDQSLFDPAVHHNGRPESPVPQPMIGQTREVLGRYAASGGTVQELVIEVAGHMPFLEQPATFVSSLIRFLADAPV